MGGFFIVSVGVICIVVIGILRILGIDYAPARFQNFLTAHLELYLSGLGLSSLMTSPNTVVVENLQSG